MKHFDEYKKVDKLWGSEHWVENNDRYCLKIMRLEPGVECSLHYHPVKQETFLVTYGAMTVEHGAGQKTILSQGDSLTLPAGEPHRFWSEQGCVFVEASSTHNEEDVVRIEESKRLG